MARTRRSPIALPAGASGAFGRRYSRRSPLLPGRRNKPRWCAAISKFTVAPAPQKRGRISGQAFYHGVWVRRSASRMPRRDPCRRRGGLCLGVPARPQILVMLADDGVPTRWVAMVRALNRQALRSPKDLWYSHTVGSWTEPLFGSTAAEDLPRIGITSIARRSRSYASPQFASCSESFAIQFHVFGQTLRSDG